MQVIDARALKFIARFCILALIGAEANAQSPPIIPVFYNHPGTVLVGQKTTFAVTGLSGVNTPGQTLTVVVELSGPPDFSRPNPVLADDCEAPIPPLASSCRVYLSFQPTIPGPQTAVLNVLNTVDSEIYGVSSSILFVTVNASGSCPVAGCPTPTPTPSPSPTPTPTPEECPVAPLTPITDPLALQFEAARGNIADLSKLEPQLAKGLQCLTKFLSNLGESPKPTSGYRPPEYQDHLREIYLKRRNLQKLNLQACSGLLSEIEAEFQSHGLGGSQIPPALTSVHETIPTTAFDLTWRDGLKPTILSNGRTIDSYACRCGLQRPYVDDKVHFTVGPKCN